jgi:outer membrane lipoprotein-sorting protein
MYRSLLLVEPARKEGQESVTADHKLNQIIEKEPLMPEPGYPQRVSQAAASRINDQGQPVCRRRMVMPIAAVAAALLILAAAASWTGLFKSDIANAMEKAVAQLSNYHGVLQMRSQNEAGEVWTVGEVELWTEGDKYAVRQADGTLTVNNGEKKWQVREQSREVALLPLLPDPTRDNFDLKDEAQRAKQYPHQEVNAEIIAGRPATKLQISPPGGLAYYLWVDKETNLPIQLQTAMQNGLQTTYTYVQFEPNTDIDPGIFTYQVPSGYNLIEDNPGQLTTSLEEAIAISGLNPLLPNTAPKRILAFKERLVLDYGDTTIVETVSPGKWIVAPNSTLGKAAGGPLEIWWERLRWRQNGMQIQVEGPQRMELARQIAPDLTLPDSKENFSDRAQVKIPVEIEVIRNSQQQADRGSSPWQLDPLQVAQTYANLQVSPEGIKGEPQLSMANFELSANNGVEALVKVSGGPIKNIYLKRLVRQDETGIWSVVGYDSR